MNKKLLIGTALASTLLFTSICVPKTFAATIEGNGQKLTSCINKLNEDGSLALYIVLPNKTHEFKKADLDKLIQDRYKGDFTIESVKKSDSDIQGITNDNENVGTGAKVTLKSSKESEESKELTVVLYGDVNGNGIVNSVDARNVAKHLNNSKKITDNALLKAADLYKTTDAEKNITISDAKRIAEASAELLTNKPIVDTELYPGDLQEVVDLDERISDVVDAINNVDGNSNKLILAVDPDDNVVDFGLVTGENKKLSEYIGAGTQLISKLQEQLKDEKLDEITLKLGQKTSTLKANASNEDIIKTACELLCEACKDCEGVTDGEKVDLEKLKDVEVSTLIGQKLEATFKIKNSNSEFTDGTTEQIYTIIFTEIVNETDIKTKVKNAVNQINEDAKKDESNLFEISINDNNVVDLKIKKENLKLEDLRGKGIKTELENLYKELNVRTVDVVYEGITYEINKEDYSAALKLITTMFGDHEDMNNLTALNGKTCEVTVKFNKVIEETKEAEETYTVNFTVDSDEAE